MSEKIGEIEKNNKRKILYVFISLFAILIIVAFAIALNNIGLLKMDNIVKPKNKAELNYTQTTNKIKEGIYITDVSEIVE